MKTHSRPRSWRQWAEIALAPGLKNKIELALSRFADGQSAEDQGEEWTELRRSLHLELEHGSGVIALHSEELARMDKGNFYRVYSQFCTSLGAPVSINTFGDVLKEVRDEGVRDAVLAPARGHLTNQKLAFHSDRADLTALACWSPSETGGEFKISSSARVIEEIEQSDQELLSFLRSPMPHDLRNEGQGIQPYALLPICSEEHGSFVVRYIRKFNESVARLGVSLPAQTIALLDRFDRVVEDPNAIVELAFAKGSFVIINNHTTLHSRNAFIDSERHKRCLLRYWLTSEFTRALPLSYLPIFHSVERGAYRGGVLVTR